MTCVFLSQLDFNYQVFDLADMIYLICYLQGRFEILSLSGSYMPTENAGTKSRSGGMSVSLAGPDGRVVGGGLAGLLIAAGPVQVTWLLRSAQNKRRWSFYYSND